VTRRAPVALAVGGAAALALAVAGACFTEKSGLAGPGNPLEGCRVPVSTRPGDVVVAMRELRFLPESVRVAAGATVVWVNCDDPALDPGLVRHTVTSDEGAWVSSPLFGPDTVFALTFGRAGVFPYHCIPHRAAGMVGRVIVE
jgi:plastocyanin